MSNTIRVLFISKESRDYFFEHLNRFSYRFIYNNWLDSARKDVSRTGDTRGDRSILLDRKSVRNLDMLTSDIKMFGGRIEH